MRARILATLVLISCGCSDEASSTATAPDPCKKVPIAYCITDQNCGEWYNPDSKDEARAICTNLRGGFGEGRCPDVRSCCYQPDTATANCSEGTRACGGEEKFCLR